MPDQPEHPSTPDDDEERQVQNLAEGMREASQDPLTRAHMSQLASAAMGDAGADDSGDEPVPPEPPRAP